MTRSDLIIKQEIIENYRDIERLSYSALRMYTKNSWDYYMVYILKDEEYIRKMKEKLDDNEGIAKGNIFDTLLTDPNAFDNMYFESEVEKKPADQMLNFVKFLLKAEGEEFSDKFKNAYNKLCEWNGGSVKMKLETYIDAFQKEGQKYYEEQLKAGDRIIITKQEYDGIKRALNKIKYSGVFKDKGEVHTKFPILFEYKGKEFKSEIDKFVIDHKNKIVYLYDYKTTMKDVNSWIWHSFIDNGYFIQSGLYKFALQQWMFDNKMEKYKVENMAFRVINPSGLQQPLLYQTTDEHFLQSFDGFYVGNKYYKGINQIIDDIDYSIENNVWDMPVDYHKNNGRILIPKFKNKIDQE